MWASKENSVSFTQLPCDLDSEAFTVPPSLWDVGLDDSYPFLSLWMESSTKQIGAFKLKQTVMNPLYQRLMRKLKSKMRTLVQWLLYCYANKVLNRSERTYNSYLLLLRLVPRLKEILEDATVDSKMFNQFITQAGFLVLFIPSTSY